MLKVLCGIIIVFYVIIISPLIYTEISIRKYNHGICTKCKSRLELIEDGDIVQVFRCPNCGNTIKV